jgi:hypothetical protein
MPPTISAPFKNRSEPSQLEIDVDLDAAAETLPIVGNFTRAAIIGHSELLTDQKTFCDFSLADTPRRQSISNAKEKKKKSNRLRRPVGFEKK